MVWDGSESFRGSLDNMDDDSYLCNSVYPYAGLDNEASQNYK